MKITEVKVLEKKNIYALKRCIRMDVDLEGYCETPSVEIDGFNNRLLTILPELEEHYCGIGEKGGFVKRLREGTYLAHICEHIILAIQNRLGMEVKYGKAREIHGDKYYIIYEYEYRNTALEAGSVAVDLINALCIQRDFNLEERMKVLRETLREEELGPSTGAIFYEAEKRGIPVIRIGEYSTMQLGYGKAGRYMEATIGENTSCVGVDISCDKLLTKELLNIQCIPVAPGGLVNNTLDLLLKAESLGYPIVLKPRYGNQGAGVIVNIQNEIEALKAYESLSSEYKSIIVERFIAGRDYRACVINGKLVACAERIPPFVIGDGVKTVEELIEEVNDNPLRGEDHEKPLTRIKTDKELMHYLKKQKAELTTILKAGERLILRENANLSTGGMAVDCTEKICEENIEILERCARTIGLDICGIDICCEDISIPLSDGGAIIEVNSAPGIRMHHYPSKGEPINVAGAILDMIFGEEFKNIPVISVTGTNGKTTTTRLIGHVLSMTGLSVGMTTTGGIYVNNSCIEKGDTTGPDSALTILMNKSVEAAVLETARGGMIRRGLAYEEADVGVITNITEDHLGLDNIDTMEDLALVKSLVVETVKPDGYSVLNAEDSWSMKIIQRARGNVVLFSKDRDNVHLQNNLRAGGLGIYCCNGYIYIQQGSRITPLIREDEIAITMGGKLRYNIENALAATAALVAMKVDYSIIRKGLQSFYCNEEQNPGRFNVYNIKGATIILDYGHNIEGYRAVMEGCRGLKPNKLIGIIGVPGDRLDSNVVEVGRISGLNLDEIYIKEDLDKRGRKSGEIAELLKKGVLSTGFNENKCEIVLNEVEALSRAIDNALPGDLIIIFFEKYEPLVSLVKEISEKLKDNSTAL